MNQGRIPISFPMQFRISPRVFRSITSNPLVQGIGVTVQTIDGGDTASLEATLDAATEQLEALDLTAQGVVADKGYHSNKVMVSLETREVRSYISEPKRGRRNWKKNMEAQKPTYANRRRIRGNRGIPCSVSGARKWSVPSLTCWRRAVYAEFMSETTLRF